MAPYYHIFESMQNTKIVQLFSSLSKVERNRLERFAHSPYHNTHRDVQELLAYLSKTDAPTLKDAHAFVFPNQAYNNAKLRNTQSYLLKLMEKFLTYEALEQDEQAMQLLLLPLYRQRGIDKGFQSAVRNTSRLLERQPYRSIQYHYQTFCLQEEQFLYAEDGKRLEDKNIQEVLDTLDIYYASNKLRYCVVALSHQNVYNVAYNLGAIETLLTEIKTREWLSVPSVAAYYHSYKILTYTHSEEDYPTLKKLFIELWQFFQPAELKELYTIAINFFIRQLNKGKTDSLQELFSLYQSGLEHGVFMVDGELSRFTYKNIASVAIKCAAYEWVAHFVAHYATQLPLQHRETYQQYCQAKLYYSIQDYKNAMYCLQTLSSTDREEVMDGKGMLVKIYYVLQEYNALDSLLSSFKIYIKRDRYMSTYLKKSYLSFVHYVQRLQQHNPYDRQERQQLLNDVQSEAQLPERQWMLQQLRG